MMDAGDALIRAGLARDLETYLRGVAESMAARRQTPYRYASYEALVLDRGQPWPGTRLPRIAVRGPMKMCYDNTLRLVRAARRRPLRLPLRYVEGYAIPWIDGRGYIPVQHAWAIDPDGDVWDPTWPEPERSAYYGIAFEWEEVERFDRLDPDALGILASEYLIECPLLRTGQLFPPDTEAAEAIIARRRATRSIG